jgi:hypothetical protein
MARQASCQFHSREDDMHSSGWVTLLRLIPPNHQENLTITTTNGAEIALYRLLRIEDEYLVARGRMMGTTDGGTFFVVPFDRINHIGFAKPIKEHQVRNIFGEACEAPTIKEATETEEETAPAAEAADAKPEEKQAPPKTGGAAPGRKKPGEGNNGAGVDKSNLLERLRARRSATDYPR